MSHLNATLVQKAAWKQARKAQLVRGGSVKEHHAEALAGAWADVKSNPVVSEVHAILAEIKAGKIKRSCNQPRGRASGYVYGCAQR